MRNRTQGVSLESAPDTIDVRLVGEWSPPLLGVAADVLDPAHYLQGNCGGVMCSLQKESCMQDAVQTSLSALN